LELLPFAYPRSGAVLLGLFVDRHGPTPFAVLAQFDPFGIVALVLHAVVITALALSASHRHPYPHYFTTSWKAAEKQSIGSQNSLSAGCEALFLSSPLVINARACYHKPR